MWWNEMRLDRHEKTLANYLRNADFSTGYFGKWHLDEDHDTLNHFGFIPRDSYLSEEWRQGFGLPQEAADIKRDYFAILKKNPNWAGVLDSTKYQHDEVIADRAIKFMTKCKKKFLCVVGFKGPHPPYAAPPPYCDLYKNHDFEVKDGGQTYHGTKLTADDWQLIKSQYYGCITWIDEIISRIRQAVPDNTMIVFTSDHGDMLGDHLQFSKGLYAYDPVVAVPLLMQIPGTQPQVINELVQHIDIIPTILELLELQIPEGVQGKNLMNLIRTGKPIYKGVLSMIGYRPRLKMLRTKRLKYWNYGGQEFLFDLKNDPGEMINQVENRYGMLSKMRGMMVNHLINAEDDLPIPKRSASVSARPR
jgi:arylsulfatase A-like enzyme